MLVDLSRVAHQLREDTFAVTLARRRVEIQQQLRDAGVATIQEGGREFKIRLRPVEERGGGKPTQK